MNRVINNPSAPKAKKTHFLLKNYDSDLNEFRRRVGIDRSRSTFMKYLIVRNHLQDYITKIYHSRDLRLDDVTEDFIRGFCHYLRVDKGLSQSTVWLYQIPVKQICSRAFNSGQIPVNPFSGYHIRPKVKARRYLTEGELKLLMGKAFDDPKLAFTRDMFVFSCWTGISFSDMRDLTEDHLVGMGRSVWIVSQRQKTGTLFRIKLMRVPLSILHRYEAERRDSHLFNIGSYTVMNDRLRRISRICGFSEHLTFHVARHTFATMAMTNGMPIESISSILGHTNIATTQIYAKLTSAKLSGDVDRLERVLRSHKLTQ